MGVDAQSKLHFMQAVLDRAAHGAAVNPRSVTTFSPFACLNWFFDLLLTPA
jgi:hypothetical protein